MKLVLGALAFALALAAGAAQAAGFQQVSVPDAGDRPLMVGVWYPSDTPPPAEPNTPFGQALALDAPVAGRRLPLIVISHGNQGLFASHRDLAQALADAGFVVAAVTHTGDNADDQSAAPSRWMVDRPRHLSRVIDYMTTAWGGHDRIDAARIGAFGFSAGGLTVLIAIGGAPDASLAGAHCRAAPEEFVCRVGLVAELQKLADAGRLPAAWAHDRRIRAAVIAAPGLGFAFDRAALARVSVPVQLWGGSADDTVPFAGNVQALAAALPAKPELHVMAAGHYAFLPPCNPRMQAAVPKVWAQICVDPPGFDRADFHRRFNQEVTAFFAARLGVAQRDQRGPR